MERLQKILAEAGYGSRRKTEELIKQGLVTVNDHIAELGEKADPKKDLIMVNGQTIKLEQKVYYLLYKPEGYLCTLSDPFNRHIVVDLLPKEPRVFPVGRLDADTTGVLLLTNDGELTNLLLHPRYHVEKAYLAEVQGFPEESALEKLRKGLVLDDGPTLPAKVELIRRGRTSSSVRIVIKEGRKRQVKRMFEAIAYPVIQLHRERFGFLELGKLQKGESRILSKSEVERLKECVIK
jgi:23S rRNA pseudouridine2605 synthase